MYIRLTNAVLGRTVGFSFLALLLSLLCFHLRFNLSSATSVHLFLVALIALRYGAVEASVMSVASAGCLDYFFTDPVFHLSISDYRNWVALATFEAAALLIATLSNRATARGRESELHQAQLNRLYNFSQSILLLDRKAAVQHQLANLIHSTLQVEGVALWNASDLKLSRSGVSSFSEAEIRSVYFSETNRDDTNGAESRRVLRLGTRPIGALLLKGHVLDAKSVNAVAALVSIAVERAQSFDSEAGALAAKQSEQLRSAILDGLAHSFKSPLTAIMTSSSGLLAMNTLSGTEHSLVELIDQQAANLADMTNHLLLTAKLDTEKVTLQAREMDLREFIARSLSLSAPELNGHEMGLEIGPGDSFRADIDEKLLRLAFTQILDNAVKYGSPHLPISIALKKDHQHFSIAVRNQGSYIPVEDRDKVFDRFYRCERAARTVSGTGIGLAVVKRIAEAHQGHASVASDLVIGTTFTIALPLLSRGAQ